MGRYITSSDTYYDNELMMLRMGLAKNKQEFTTVGASTWTLDHDAMVRVRVWGGGGGGDTYTTSHDFSGMGGGAGGWAEIIIKLTAGSYPITVGSGGKGSGGTGGTSSFSNIASATGGFGGSRSEPTGSRGGTASINSELKFLYYKLVCGGSGGKGGAMNFNSAKFLSYARGGGDSGGSFGYIGGGGGGYGGEQLYGAVIASPSKNVGFGGNASGYGGGGGGGGSSGAEGFSGIVVVEWN